MITQRLDTPWRVLSRALKILSMGAAASHLISVSHATVWELDAKGIIGVGSGIYWTYNQPDPSISVGTPLHFSATFDDASTPTRSLSDASGTLSKYALRSVNYDFGDVHISTAGARYAELDVSAGFNKGWSIGLSAKGPLFGSGADLVFFYRPGAFSSSVLPLMPDFQNQASSAWLVASQSSFLGGSPYRLFAQTTITSFSFAPQGPQGAFIAQLAAIPEPGSASAFLGAACFLAALTARCIRKKPPYLPQPESNGWSDEKEAFVRRGWLK